MGLNLKSMMDEIRAGNEIDVKTSDEYEKALNELLDQAERFGTNG